VYGSYPPQHNTRNNKKRDIPDTKGHATPATNYDATYTQHPPTAPTTNKPKNTSNITRTTP
jgi:hypothetical protein